MTYTIITPKAVQKQLDALPDEIYDRIAVNIQQLAEEPRPELPQRHGNQIADCSPMRNVRPG